jgi:ceramide glucosyltransferase
MIMGGFTHLVSTALLIASAIGVAIVVLQVFMLARHLLRPAPVPRARPPISILKPLCGLDDELADNLAVFAALPYPDYEVLLGVASAADPAYAVAAEAARRWPARFRVVIQRGAPGLNPKVNQLLGLASEARADILVVSDSNTRVPPGYLDEIAAHLEDPTVGLVTHAIAGSGEERGRAAPTTASFSASFSSTWGARLDNLHITGTMSTGFVAASALCGKTYVVGKSMAVRREDLEAVGGLDVVKDVLAEDFVLGRLIPEALGKRVVLGRAVVECITVRRSLTAFASRYARWSVMQRQCAGLTPYLGLLLLNPVLLATCALVLAPSRLVAAGWAVCALIRALADSFAGRLARGRAFGVRSLLLVPLKELLTGAAWLHGLVSRSIVWRSNHLIVGRGSALSLVPASARWRARSFVAARLRVRRARA